MPAGDGVAPESRGLALGPLQLGRL